MVCVIPSKILETIKQSYKQLETLKRKSLPHSELYASNRNVVKIIRMSKAPFVLWRINERNVCSYPFYVGFKISFPLNHNRVVILPINKTIYSINDGCEVIECLNSQNICHCCIEFLHFLCKQLNENNF